VWYLGASPCPLKISLSVLPPSYNQSLEAYQVKVAGAHRANCKQFLTSNADIFKTIIIKESFRIYLSKRGIKRSIITDSDMRAVLLFKTITVRPDSKVEW